MAVLATASLLLLFFFLSVCVNAAEQADDDVTAYQPSENDVTRSPCVKNYDVDGVKAKFLNVLERKLKTFPHQKQVGGVGKAPQPAGAIEAIKRRSWAENSMSAWGKRRSQALQLAEPRFKRSAPYPRRRRRRMSANPTGTDWGDEASLGKGRVTPSEFSDEDVSDEGPMDQPGRGRLAQLKRLWSDHSMNTWGKRLQTGNPVDSSGDEEGASDPQPPHPPLPPKGLSSNQIYFVLLQQQQQQHHRNGISKRNWSTNTMDVWGKRSTPEDRGDSPGYETHMNTVSLYSN